MRIIQSKQRIRPLNIAREYGHYIPGTHTLISRRRRPGIPSRHDPKNNFSAVYAIWKYHPLDAIGRQGG